MKQFLIFTTLFLSFSIYSINIQAQSTTPNNSLQQIQSELDLPFNLEDLFNFDNFMEDLQTEMESTRSIWSQFLSPLLIDSMVNQLDDFNIGGSVDTIIQKFQLGVEENGDMGIGNLLEQFFQNFDLENITSPNSIIPNPSDDVVAPQANPQSQPVQPKSKGKNKTII